MRATPNFYFPLFLILSAAIATSAQSRSIATAPNPDGSFKLDLKGTSPSQRTVEFDEFRPSVDFVSTDN